MRGLRIRGVIIFFMKVSEGLFGKRASVYLYLTLTVVLLAHYYFIRHIMNI